MKSEPEYRDIVLAGGGYAHLLFIRLWCKQPLPGVRVTLISPQHELPYSGMLPGYLAGQYTHEDIHIDVAGLCQRAGVRLLLDEVCGVDAGLQRVQLRNQPALAYDVLSLNTGSAADISVPGVAEHAIPVKPVTQFLPRWQLLLAQLRSCNLPQHIVMTGGGAGSVEILLGMAQATRQDASLARQPAFTLLTASERLLPTYPVRVAQLALDRCRALGIQVLCGKRVSRVEAGHLFTADSFNAVLRFDVLLWCAEAAAPDWLQHCGLALDDKGFLRVRETLQSVSNPAIFAAGDLAAFEPGALPKAGVYAVHQAPLLFHNLTQFLLLQPLQHFRPRPRFLSLLNLGAGYSAGSYGALSATGTWLARWKANIDRRFVRSFKQR